ncbi:MAG: pre-peptidase C-terminal domain-containing protein [Sulfurovum sp.]|nr:pre-peptidase C-terminal domain-containing protein [Sulfurovum sp.]
MKVSTRAFGGGCITNVGDYAKKRTCNASSANQLLIYTSNRSLRDPSTNKCLTAQSYSNGSKITYTRCQPNSAEQIFSYLDKTKRFLHIASHKCLDVHGGNRTDLILWRCHGGINQKFYIPSPRTGGSDDHGNNTATPIALKSTTRGRIEAAGSGDYFKIIIPSGKRGTLIINTTGSTDTYGSLLGGSGAQLALDDNSGSGHNFRISISVTAGTYYAKVRHHSPTGIGSYALVSHFVPDDHTSSRIAATSINPNSTTQGRIEVAGDVDFFKIRIPSSGTLVVKTTGLTDTYGTLLNANGHQIASDDNGSTYSNFRILKSVSTGTYYVKVKHSSASSIGYYTLISQFISDDYGNTRSTAKPINPNSTTQGRIEVDGDVDFFKIQIHSRGTLVVKTTGLTDTYGTLLNANGHQIASDDNGSAYSNFKISKSVTAGTYYVKVKHSSALLAGSYVLVSHFEASYFVRIT